MLEADRCCARLHYSKLSKSRQTLTESEVTRACRDGWADTGGNPANEAPGASDSDL